MEATRNTPAVWFDAFPSPAAGDHKYRRGHAVIMGATDLTGATRLAAGACSRIGAGLVTVMAGESANILRTSLPADIMVSEGRIADLRQVGVVLAGPGGTEPSQDAEILELDPSIPLVLDASAIALHGTTPSSQPRVLTPHEGEFATEFADIDGDLVTRARAAAQRSQSVVILKGPQTVVAGADGHATMHDRPNPYLAKAGTGDVLAGLVAGLIAQGMPLFEAASAAVWLHGEAGARCGVGLTAPDLEAAIPPIMTDLLEARIT